MVRKIVLAIAAALLASCATPPPPPPVRPPAPPVAPAPEPQPPAAATPERRSDARTPRDYRRDGAGHLYSHYGQRIYKGKMPPLLYAVGVLQVEIDSRGHVAHVSWMRKPSATDVVSEIERMVRAAAPYPAPARLGRVTYTDTWLWHKTGQFQLDTLTEGQL